MALANKLDFWTDEASCPEPSWALRTCFLKKVCFLFVNKMFVVNKVFVVNKCYNLYVLLR